MGQAGTCGCSIPIPADFRIPKCPVGRVLEIYIYSTWGDPYYVGLSGLELFDSQGQLVDLRDPASRVEASPESINELEEYENDPRTPDNIIDGDDHRFELCPVKSIAREFSQTVVA